MTKGTIQVTMPVTSKEFELDLAQHEASTLVRSVDQLLWDEVSSNLRLPRDESKSLLGTWKEVCWDIRECETKALGRIIHIRPDSGSANRGLACLRRLRNATKTVKRLPKLLFKM